MAQIRAFVDRNAPIAFSLTDRAAAHRHGTRADKGLLRRYLAKVTGGHHKTNFYEPTSLL